MGPNLTRQRPLALQLMQPCNRLAAALLLRRVLQLRPQCWLLEDRLRLLLWLLVLPLGRWCKQLVALRKKRVLLLLLLLQLLVVLFLKRLLLQALLRVQWYRLLVALLLKQVLLLRLLPQLLVVLVLKLRRLLVLPLLL